MGLQHLITTESEVEALREELAATKTTFFKKKKGFLDPRFLEKSAEKAFRFQILQLAVDPLQQLQDTNIIINTFNITMLPLIWTL